jgi:hypothetical protein
MKVKESLQKLTDLEMKINSILDLKKITPIDIDHLNRKEYEFLLSKINKQFNELKGEQRDSYFEKIEAIVSTTTKNQLWEKNHNEITWAISVLIQEYGRMPSKTEIAAKTELSRQTVHKHLKEYHSHPEYIGQVEQFKFMASKVFAKVYHLAIAGDVAAAKLYFSVLGYSDKFKSNTTRIQNQNNYIQINGTVLSQETVKQLDPEQLNTIETILNEALHKNNSISKKD